MKNHYLKPTTRVLLSRIRDAYDAIESRLSDGTGECQLTDDEIVSRGLALLAEQVGADSDVSAASLCELDGTRFDER